MAAAAASIIKLYGVPLSPPFRAVAWTLLQRRVPFEIAVAVPGSKGRNGTAHADFLALTNGRTSRVPILKDESGRVVFESPAILKHVAILNGWSDLYPEHHSTSTAMIDSYLSWHSEGTRQIARLTQPLLRPDLKLTVGEEEEEAAHAVLKQLDTAWLSESPFLSGDADADHHSVADMLCYEEISQAMHVGGLVLTDYPNIEAWRSRMQQVDFYSEAHASLAAFSSADPAIPLMKRLGAATKEGLDAVKTAQASY